MLMGGEPSTARLTPDDRHASAWSALQRDPGPLVFLLGCQRSGTTWLHLLLARTGRFRFVSAYDVVAADRLVDEHLSGRAAAARAALDTALGGVADRGIDTIPAGAETPEEYGLAMASDDERLRYGRPDTTEATLPRLAELCAKKAFIEGRDRPLLLKSPPDYPWALDRLARAWPQARFITIHRHPLRTLDAQVRAWRDLVRRPNPYLRQIDRSYRALCDDPNRRLRLGLWLRSAAGVGGLADHIVSAHRAYLEAPRRLSERTLAVRYEDLCRSPTEVLGRLSSFLQVELTLPGERAAPRRLQVGAEARRAFADRLDIITPYLERFGYSAQIDGPHAH